MLALFPLFDTYPTVTVVLWASLICRSSQLGYYLLDFTEWYFLQVAPGETALAFYTATNPTDEPITGISTYNVVPFEAGQYFNKIQVRHFMLSCLSWFLWIIIIIVVIIIDIIIIVILIIIIIIIIIFIIIINIMIIVILILKECTFRYICQLWSFLVIKWDLFCDEAFQLTLFLIVKTCYSWMCSYVHSVFALRNRGLIRMNRYIVQL